MNLYDRPSDFDDLLFSDKMVLLNMYREHWGPNLKTKSDKEQQRYLTTIANKRRAKNKAVAKRRAKRKANKRQK